MALGSQGNQGTQGVPNLVSNPSFGESNKQTFAFGGKSDEQKQQQQNVSTNQPAFGTNHTANLSQSNSMFNQNQNNVGQATSTGNLTQQGTNNIKTP